MNSLETKRPDGCRCLIPGGALFLVGLAVLIPMDNNDAQADPLVAQMQMSPMRQDSIKMSSVPDVPREPVSAVATPSSGTSAQMPSQLPFPEGVVVSGYDPAGRRDPFAPVLQDLRLDKIDMSLPPLQRVALTELSLIAIVWGAYGYTAMVQTPEGHGYTIRPGTRVGHNNGVVSAITERGIIVQERFTDAYGKKQEHESVKLLHPKEGSE
jgi:type IV pilus assembly protein PilP